MLLVVHAEGETEIANWVEGLMAPVKIPVLKHCVVEEAFPSAVETCADALKQGGTVLAIFFDGASDASKQVLLGLKAACAAFTNVQLQALNAKKGQHSLFSNGDAVVASILKKMPSAPSAAAPPVVAEVDWSVITQESVANALHRGHGEVLWSVTCPCDEFEQRIQTLVSTAAALSVNSFEVGPRHTDQGRSTVDVMLRQPPPHRVELRMAICGNVDSGKSTLTSVLTHGQMDDGRGSARAKVFVHQHEADTGRTSSISENHIGFDGAGSVVNYSEQPTRHGLCTANIAANSSKICTLYDLAGHEKYLKTTVLGMTRNVPDYACIVISANNGIQRMTKEHLGLCLALRLPFFVVITRIDATPPNIRTATYDSIIKLLKAPTVKKLPVPVKTDHDVVIASRNLKQDHITPIFEVSNVTGEGIDKLLRFVDILPVRTNWDQFLQLPKEMIIDSTFFVTGVGTVVGGIVTQGTFRVNDTVLIGPDGLGNFRPVQIKSIHSKGIDVDHVECGNDAAFCLKKEKRSAIRKGNVLVDPAALPKAYWQFEAEIRILYHSTTISTNYEPVIHSQTVRQSARIVSIDREVLRTGDHALVRFHFLYRPEYMKVGQRIIFREGRTKGIGTIANVRMDRDDEFCGASREAVKQSVREKHEKKPA